MRLFDRLRPHRRLLPHRALAALAAALLVTAIAQTAAPRPAAASGGIRGIQAGDVLDFGNNCARTPSADTLLADGQVRSASGWLRLDLRGMHDVGCALEAYKSFINDLGTGMKIIALLGRNFYNDVGPEEFAAYAKTIACDTDGFQGIEHWEVWNEPNIDAGSPGATPLAADAFARYIGLTSAAIHGCAGDEAADDKVLSGGVTPADPIGYLRAVSDQFLAHAADAAWAGGYGSLVAAVDGIAIHPYVDAIREDRVENGRRHFPLANMVWQFTSGGFGFDSEPIYITEMGWRLPVNDTDPLVGDVVSAQEQCLNLVKAYEGLNSEADIAVTAAVWFTLQDFGALDRKYGLWVDGSTARSARQGYISGDCPDTPQAGVYNQQAEQLEWQDGTAAAAATTLAATSYEVLLAPSNSPTFTTTKATSGLSLPLMGWSPPLSPGTYVWRVTKVVDGKRYPSKEQWKFTFSGLPSAPTGPSITAAADGTSLTLSWTDTSLIEDGFIVSDGVETRTAARNATSLQWTGLVPGTALCLRVQSYTFYGTSAFTSPICATTPDYPAAPTGATATVISGTSVRIDWTDNATNEIRYEINDGTTTRIADADATTFTWDGLANGATKCFRIRAYNAVGHSPWASAPCVVTPTIPAAPTGPAVTVASGTALKITWTDKSANENGFQVYDGVEIRQTTANITSLTWGPLPNGANKCFRVRSFNLAGYSAWSAQVCGTTPTIPAAPTGPIATVVSGTQIMLSWTDKSSNETGFEVNNGTETRQAGGANATSFVWTGLANGTYLCLRVRSKNLAGASAWTGYACATTPTIPASPTILSAYPISSSQIVITWSDRSNNETMFQVYNQMSFQNTAANATSHTWGGIAPNTTMCFNVRAYNLAGSSTPTPYLCAKTYGPPSAPTNPAASRVSPFTLRFAWTDTSSNETGFQVFDGVNYKTYSANTTVHYLDGLAIGTYRCFQVRSFNQWGYSAWTAQSCAATY